MSAGNAVFGRSNYQDGQTLSWITIGDIRRVRPTTIKDVNVEGDRSTGPFIPALIVIFVFLTFVF
jgi:hypothetical protein